MKTAMWLLAAGSAALAQSHLSGIKAEVKSVLRITPRSAGGPCSPSAPCSASVNVPYDAEGTPDTRPGTWGNAAALQVPMQFANVPSGYRVRLLRLYGDHIAWVHGPVQPGTHAGILWGIFSTAVHLGSANVPYGNDACMIYHQGSVSTGDFVQSFDNDVHPGGLLEPDNTMILQLAVFENETGSSVHQEITFVLVYDFEPAPAPPPAQ
jgi:hypothetical protein